MIETLYQNRADMLHKKRSKNTVIQVTLTTKCGNTFISVHIHEQVQPLYARWIIILTQYKKMYISVTVF